MANEAEQAIYQRLAAAARYHPGSADLFVNDWALEPGDVVTVQADETDYSLPVFGLKLDWTGQSTVSVEATGNKARAPLPELKRRRYSGGRTAHEETKELDTRITADIVKDRAKIGLVVEETDEGNNVIRSASIMAAISNDTTSVDILADVITFKGYVNIEDLSADAAEFLSIHVDDLTVHGDLTASGDVQAANLSTDAHGTIAGGSVETSVLEVYNAYAHDLFIGSDDSTQPGPSVTGAVTGFLASTASGGTITIPYKTFASGSSAAGNITFNIADTEYYQDHVGIDTLSLVSVTQTDYDAASCTEKTVTDDTYYITTVMANDGSTSQFKFHTPNGAAGVTVVPDDSSITSELTTYMSVQKGTTTYSSQGSIALTIRFTLSNGKRYRRATSVSVGAQRVVKPNSKLYVYNDLTQSYSLCSDDKFYYMN